VSAVLAVLEDRVLVVLVAFVAGFFGWLAFGGIAGRFLARRRETAETMARRLHLAKPSRMAVFGAPLVGVLVFLVFTLLGMWIFGVAVGFFAYKLLDAMPKVSLKTRAQKFEEQLVDALIGMSNGLKAGMSLPQAVEQVARDMPPPLSQEFGRILREYNHGKTIEQAFEDAGKRLDSRNFNLTILAFHAGKQQGGNLAVVFEKIAASIREIYRLEEHIKTISTEGRSSARFMTFMPLVFLALLFFMDSASMMLLFTDPIGLGILTVVLLFNVIGHLWIRRILDVDV
jgi:tight adherence protein B